MFNYLEENDLVVCLKTIYWSKDSETSGFSSKIHPGEIMIILENRFGATFRHRYLKCFVNNKVVFIKQVGLNVDLDNSFKRINGEK